MGVYDEWRPYAVPIGGVFELEIDKPGHVVVIAISAADPAYRDRFHNTFRVVFPRTEVDSTYYPAGRHRLRVRAIMRGMDRLCREGEVPTVYGCRMTRGRGGPVENRNTSYTPRQYIAIVSEERMDPYSVAHYLEEAVVFSPTLEVALHARDANAAAEEMAAALLKSPIPSVWAGHYAVEN